MRSCLSKSATCKLTTLLLRIPQEMCGDQQKMIPVVVVERLWPVLGLGLLKAAPSRTCEAGSVWKLPLRLHFTTASYVAEASGSWSPAACFPEGCYSISQRAIWCGEVSPGSWSLTSAVVWISSLTGNYNFHVALRSGGPASVSTCCEPGLERCSGKLLLGSGERCLVKISIIMDVVVVIDCICCYKC